ncbi:hypothetical protein V5N11_020068 [Cardamine amara subsp. amara]|uniref:Reverse transcriptase zinc-binding domain-containing protein n=1 Tax=Cardamine amara subsp. amara TaxID=228776 RepID=A0ABD0ZJM3_CARAN
MQQWSSGAHAYCVLCQNNLETRNHIFFSCSFSAEIWDKLVKNLLQQKHSREWDQLMRLLMDTSLDKVYLFLLRYTFQAALHIIWQERNNKGMVKYQT